jgi:ribulose-phosphate 3-epimerase
VSVRIAPSLLSADFARLKDEIADVESGGADLLHLDVMDGHFVPNITFGPPLVAAVRGATSLCLDAHLMITDPLAYAEPFAKAGADIVSFHVEAVRDANPVIDKLLACGVKPAMVVNPATPARGLAPYFDRLHLVLVMSVNPGFGGQRFMPEVLPKVRALRDLGFRGEIEIDGGINAETARLARDAGATILVAGSSVFGSKDRRLAIEGLRGPVPVNREN